MRGANDGRLYCGLVLFVLAACILATVPLFGGSGDGAPQGSGNAAGAEASQETEGDISSFCTEWLEAFYRTELGREAWLAALEPVTGSDLLAYIEGFLSGETDWREVEDYLIVAKTFLEHATPQQAEVSCLGAAKSGGVWKAQLEVVEAYEDPGIPQGYRIERSFYLVVSEAQGRREVLDLSSSY